MATTFSNTGAATALQFLNEPMFTKFLEMDIF